MTSSCGGQAVDRRHWNFGCAITFGASAITCGCGRCCARLHDEPTSPDDHLAPLADEAPIRQADARDPTVADRRSAGIVSRTDDAA